MKYKLFLQVDMYIKFEKLRQLWNRLAASIIDLTHPNGAIGKTIKFSLSKLFASVQYVCNN